jgi:hypothetical protein
VAGGLVSACVIGASVAGTQLAGAGPVSDDLLNALSPFGWFNLVPIAAAVASDAACRRGAFWLATGWRPTWGSAIVTALIAPAAAVAIGWRAGAIAWVLGASTVLLRCCAEAAPGAPRWFATLFVRRSRGAIAATVLAAILIAAGGLLSLQLGTPALRVSPIEPASSSPRDLEIANRTLADVTVLGIGGPVKDYVRFGGQASAPFALPRGASRSISLIPGPGCRNGGGGVSILEVRYRILGIERISSLELGREIRIRCQ